MTNGGASRMELVLGRVLHFGSIGSTILLIIGLMSALWLPASWPATFFLQAGLIVLMATPVARVVVSVGEYAAGRDWLFVALTMIVLLVLLGSLLVAVSA